jgi:hypothetical protein
VVETPPESPTPGPSSSYPSPTRERSTRKPLSGPAVTSTPVDPETFSGPACDPAGIRNEDTRTGHPVETSVLDKNQCQICRAMYKSREDIKGNKGCRIDATMAETRKGVTIGCTVIALVYTAPARTI